MSSEPAKGTGFRAVIEDDFDVMAAVGGVRGTAESTIPTLLFLILYTVTGQLNVALIIAVASSLVAIALRAFQRIPVSPALGGLFAIALSAFVAYRSGEASNFFVWGLMTNLVYGAVLLVSLLVRFPAVGVLIGFLRGDAIGWRKDPAQALTRRRYTQVTWLWLALFVARLAVQTPLYLSNATEAIGIARLFMGIPLFALVGWFSWLMVKDLPAVPAAAESNDV
ncbi:DUF3159 domain-containing protein [Trueperella pyogenes]|uniref:DUF3159 domain-containing protein n=1 Tax=Trueperella pyogenes TaxID=1661 RepID=UPI00345D8EE4